jgi:hypothetical protein
MLLSACPWALAQPAVAKEETFNLDKALYFDCTISSDQDPAKIHEMDVTYFVYADKPGPQLNFFDPSKLVSDQSGWAQKDHFLLFRQVSDRELFIWQGRSIKGSSPLVDSTFELTPKMSEPSRAALVVTRFTEGNAGAIVARKFKGECGTLSGKAAWDLYQNGGTK